MLQMSNGIGGREGGRTKKENVTSIQAGGLHHQFHPEASSPVRHTSGRPMVKPFLGLFFVIHI